VNDLRIPFNRVTPAGRELEYVAQAIQRGHISGHGPFTRECESILERELGAGRVLLTTSCTHALEMAALLLDIQPGDDVILPAFTFVSTVNAFALRGARPVFVDIRDDTLNLDETLVERAVTSRTKAIVAVHYAGVGCEMTALQTCAGNHGVAVVEDNAHGLFGRYRGHPLGTLGALATLSFHETKNVSCGEGGALVVNDPHFIARAEILREKGTDRSRFLRGEVDKYSWQDLGSSYIPSDMLAAFLLGQLESRHEIQERRHDVFARYHRALHQWAGEHGVGLLHAPGHAEHPSHMFYLRLRDEAERSDLIAVLKASGVLAVSHYVPLHLAPMGVALGYRAGDLPVTERAAAQLLRLPLFPSLSPTDQASICRTLVQFTPRQIADR
jgi:dTDP-4-amino-4,6-dideoxygalactose transaminase